MNGLEVVAAEPYLYGRNGIAVIKLLDAHLCLGKMVGISRGETVNEGHSGSVVIGIHDELRIVSAAKLRGVRVLETRRRHAVERRNVAYALVGLHHVAQTIGHGSRTFDARSLWQVDLYGKLVALGTRHKFLWQASKEHRTNNHRECANAQSDERMGKATLDKAVVIGLHDVEEGASLFTLALVFFLQTLTYKGELHPRHYQNGHQKRCA